MNRIKSHSAGDGLVRRFVKSFRLSLAAATLSGAVFGAQPIARAALMAYEGFNYPSGSGNLTGQTGGFGWSGAWQEVVNGNSTVLGGSLTAVGNAPSGYDAHSVGGAAFTPNGTRAGRFLDASAGGVFALKGYLNGSGAIGAAGKTIYISFMQQPNVANNNYYEFEFHRGNLNDPGRVGGVGCDTGGSSSVYLRTPSTNQTPIGPASTSVSFYVVRIDFMSGNDTVSVYQNPTSATEPAIPTLVEAGAGDMSFNGISFGAFVNGATVAHDEVRIGETWGDVVSPGAYSAGKWMGGGGNNNWSLGANWDNGVVPVFASSLTFLGSAGLNNTNDLTGVSANSITFDSAAGAFTLNGNSLGLNGNITFNGNPASPITQTISLPLTPSVNVTVDIPANGSLVLDGGITSGSSLTKIDSGMLVLSGTNTFGALNASGGTNIITGNTTITGNGGDFYLADGDFISGCKDTTIIQPGAALTVVGSYGDSGVIGRDGGSGTVIQNGGLFSFNPAPPSGPYLFIGAANNPATRSEYDMNGGVLDLNGNTLGIALGANIVVTGLVNQVSGVITNVGNLYFSPLFNQGHGIYRLTGGTIYIGSGGITVFGSGAYEIYLGGGTVGAEASWSSALNMTLTGNNGPVTFNPGGNTITLSGVLSGSGGLIANGAGVLELSGANTYTGDTLVAAGSTLQLDSTGSGPGAIRLASGSTFNLNYNGNYAVSALYLNGVLQPAGTYNSTTSPGYIIGTGNLVVSSISSGIWTGLGANNNWSTGGNWDNGVAPIFPHALTFVGNNRLNNNNDLSGITISTLTFSNTAGAFTLGGNAVALSGGIGFSGNPPSPITQTVNLDMARSADLTIDTPANGNLWLGGNITTSGNNLTKIDGGTLTLGGVDSFAGLSVNGGTNVITGTLNLAGTGGSRFYLGDGDTLPDSLGTLVIQPGAALSVTGSFGDAGVIGRDSGSGTVIQNGGTFSFNPANVADLFVGASGSTATRAEYDMNGGTLDMNGLNLAVALSANGATLITGLVSQVSGSITNVGELDLGAFTLGPGRGIYKMTGGSIYLGAGGILSDSGVYEIYLGGGTVGANTSWSSALKMTLTGVNGPVTFDTAGNSIHLTGILSGAGGFNVIGGGIVELGGANTYLGDSVVSSGTLQLDATGSSTGAFRVANGGLLNLNYTGNYVVAGFYTNGVALPFGTYNSANLPGFISGSGNLVVQGVSTGRWVGGGANNNWSVAGNWDNNAEPVFPIGLTFAGNSRLNNTNDLAGVTATSLVFDSTAGAFTLNGNSLGLSGDLGFNANPPSPIAQTIDLPLAPVADINVDTPANGNLAVNGGISAPNNTVYKVNAGTLTLGGNNIFAGFDVDGGTNIITGNTTITGTGGTRIYVANADYVGGSVGTLVIPSGASFAINGNFADACVIGRDGGIGRLIQNGGTFSFNPGNQTYLFIGAANNPTTRAEYDMNGGLLDMNGKTLGMALGVNVLVTGVVNQVSGVITNVGQIFFDSFFSTGHSIYNMSGGSLYLESGGITVQSGGTYEIYLGGGMVGALASWSSSLNMTLTGNNGATTFNPGGNTILLSGVLSGSGGLTVAGGGILELPGDNTYTGDTTVGAGSTLRFDSTNNNSATFREASGATLNLNYTGTMTVASFYTNNVALAGGIYNSGNLPGYLTGTGSLRVAGLPGTPVPIMFGVSGGKLNLSWPANYQGWILQQQTNSLNLGLGANWVDVAGSAGVTSTNIPINPAMPTAFYRLRYPSP